MYGKCLRCDKPSTIKVYYKGEDMTEKDLNIKVRDDGVYILETENYRFHLDEKTHIEKIGKLINENEQLKQQLSEQGTQIDFLKDENTHMRNVLNENKQLKEKIKDLEKKNEQLKQKIKSINEILNEDIGYIESFRRIEEVLK